jgi:hypothetical protein
VGEESVSALEQKIEQEDQKLKQIPRRYQRKENVNYREKMKCGDECLMIYL